MMPLDVIETMKNKRVDVELRNGKIYTGILRSFDLFSNIGIEMEGKLKFIQGESVLVVSLAK